MSVLATFCAAVAMALVSACASLDKPPAVSGVVAFGDSLSDGGAAHALSLRMLAEHVSGAFEFPGPASVYFNRNWSNGPTAVMHFAADLGVPIDNLALGGATTSHLLYDVRPGTPPLFDAYLKEGGGVLGQIERHLAALASARQHPDPHAVYVLWAGWNDYFRWSDYRLPGTHLQVADQAVANLGAAVARLRAAGARRVLLVNSPSSPVLAQLQDNVRFDAFKRRFNDGLSALATTLARARPELEAKLFDAYAADAAILAQAASNGFTDAATPCLFVFSVATPTPRCATPDTHYYWDEVHPTTRAHRLLADAMRKLYR